jgi:uncharacterized protein YegL
MSRFPLRRTRRRALHGRTVPAVIALVIGAVILSRCDSSGNSQADNSVQAVPDPISRGKYVPSVDEGLGASIAILLDVSGSMKDVARSDRRPKYIVAREAIQAMLDVTDSFVRKQTGFPVNVGLYTFNAEVQRIVPIGPYNKQALHDALAGLGIPKGGTAIGDAMNAAREDLYGAGTFRKYILVVTDGENTNGREPAVVAREIARRSEGAVRQYFVAFDIDREKFAFLRQVNGDVLGAANGDALRVSLDSIYRGRILAEAMNAGETLPSPSKPPGTGRDTGGTPRKNQP